MSQSQNLGISKSCSTAWRGNYTPHPLQNCIHRELCPSLRTPPHPVWSHTLRCQLSAIGGMSREPPPPMAYGSPCHANVFTVKSKYLNRSFGIWQTRECSLEMKKMKNVFSISWCKDSGGWLQLMSTGKQGFLMCIFTDTDLSVTVKFFAQWCSQKVAHFLSTEIDWFVWWTSGFEVRGDHLWQFSHMWENSMHHSPSLLRRRPGSDAFPLGVRHLLSILSLISCFQILQNKIYVHACWVTGCRR